MPTSSQPVAFGADVITLPCLELPRPNPGVLRLLAGAPLRDPLAARGRPLYLQRLGLVALPHERVGDVEVAAAVEVRDVCHPVADLTPGQFCAAWLVRVWDRWPGGRRVQVAQALVEFVEPDSLTVATAPGAQPGLARRAGLAYPRGIARHCAELAAVGLLAARSGPSRWPDEQRRYQLRLPPAAVCAAPAAAFGAVPA